MLPYLRFDLRPTILSRANLSKVSMFLKQYGPCITYLCVNMAFESEDNFPVNCLPNISLSNLKTLEFHVNIRGEQRPSFRTDLETTRHNFLASLLNCAPQLESLVFWCDSENILWPDQVIQAFSQCPNLSNCLRHLKLSFPMRNNFCTCLRDLSERKFPLKSFTLVIREPILISPDIIFSLLSSFQPTLEELTIVDLQGSYSKPIELPHLPVLKSLTFEGALVGGNCTLYLNKFSFSRVPQLKKLVLKYCHQFNFDMQSLLYCSHYPHLNLTELHVSLEKNCFDTHCVIQASILFPRLKVLNIDFNSESKFILRDVFQQMQTIQELTVNLRKCEQCIDDVLCGLPTDFCDEMKGRGVSNDCVFLIQSAHDWTDLCEYPSLKDMISEWNYFGYIF